MVDHWIRVHPEQPVRPASHVQDLRSRVKPVSEFLRIIVLKDRGQAETVSRRLSQGEAFAALAREFSVDATAAIGGYLSAVRVADMDARLGEAASVLPYGERTGAIDMGDRWIMLQRMPRDFKWEAEQSHERAVTAKLQGDVRGALENEKQALETYPYFLRGLIFMGVTLAENGDPRQANEILQFAAHQYPADASTQFNLGLTFGRLGRHAQEIEAYRRAIEFEPDLVSVYENLGAALYALGEKQNAIDTFRRGLDIDPLSPILYYDLSLALEAQKDVPGAERAMALAIRLDPDLATHHPR